MNESRRTFSSSSKKAQGYPGRRPAVSLSYYSTIISFFYHLFCWTVAILIKRTNRDGSSFDSGTTSQHLTCTNGWGGLGSGRPGDPAEIFRLHRQRSQGKTHKFGIHRHDRGQIDPGAEEKQGSLKALRHNGFAIFLIFAKPMKAPKFQWMRTKQTDKLKTPNLWTLLLYWVWK